MKNLLTFALATVVLGTAAMNAMAPKAEALGQRLQNQQMERLCQIDVTFCD